MLTFTELDIGCQGNVKDAMNDDLTKTSLNVFLVALVARYRAVPERECVSCDYGKTRKKRRMNYVRQC